MREIVRFGAGATTINVNDWGDWNSGDTIAFARELVEDEWPQCELDGLRAHVLEHFELGDELVTSVVAILDRNYRVVSY